MRVFVEQFIEGGYTGIGCMPNATQSSDNIYNNDWYDLYGRQTEKPYAPGIYIKNGKKTLVK
jgi:hypothetical protein